MTENTFRPGDFVRFTGAREGWEHIEDRIKVGDTFRVEEVHGEFVRFTIPGEVLKSGWFHDQFELANPFKKGDRVRVRSIPAEYRWCHEAHDVTVGKVFTVVKDDSLWVRIKTASLEAGGWSPGAFELAPESEVEQLQRELAEAQRDARQLQVDWNELHEKLQATREERDRARGERDRAWLDLDKAQGALASIHDLTDKALP